MQADAGTIDIARLSVFVAEKERLCMLQADPGMLVGECSRCLQQASPREKETSATQAENVMPVIVVNAFTVNGCLSQSSDLLCKH